MAPLSTICVRVFFFFFFSFNKIIIHKKKKKLQWEKGKKDLRDVSKTSFLCFLI
jgi:hypothetical protein